LGYDAQKEYNRVKSPRATVGPDLSSLGVTGKIAARMISMREYVLTQRERKILQTFLESGIKLNGFSVLALRLKRASKRIGADTKLISATLEKLETEK